MREREEKIVYSDMVLIVILYVSVLNFIPVNMLISGIWYNPTLAMVVLQRYKLPQCGDQGVTEQFFNQLFSDTDVFMGIHDKKVTMIDIGRCAL